MRDKRQAAGPCGAEMETNDSPETKKLTLTDLSVAEARGATAVKGGKSIIQNMRV
jgi:hypothetical protein